MNVPADATLPFRADAYTETEGEFAGWTTWKRDSFESVSGPFWHKVEADGSVRCAFRVEPRHLNGMKNVHGGCYMTFADYCLFAMSSRELQGPGITVSFGCEFLDAAKEGTRANRARVDEDDSKGVADLRAKGMTVIDNVDKAKFVAMLAPVNADFEKQFGKANIDAIRNVK